MNTDLASTFAELGGDGVGQITGAEFAKAIVARSESITEDEIASIFADADSNRDGRISSDEFTVAWQRTDPA